MIYEILANVVLAIHVLTALFLCITIPVVAAGGWLSWDFVKLSWWRNIHFGMLVTLGVESIFDLPCPLTVWEIQLRELANAPLHGIETSSIYYWSSRLFGLDLSRGVINNVCLSVFLAAAILYILVPPNYLSRPVESIKLKLAKVRIRSR